jgi:hypothetical protein
MGLKVAYCNLFPLVRIYSMNNEIANSIVRLFPRETISEQSDRLFHAMDCEISWWGALNLIRFARKEAGIA